MSPRQKVQRQSQTRLLQIATPPGSLVKLGRRRNDRRVDIVVCHILNSTMLAAAGWVSTERLSSVAAISNQGSAASVGGGQ